MRSLRQFVDSGSKVLREQKSDRATEQNLLEVAAGWREHAEDKTFETYIRHEAAYNAVYASSLALIAMLSHCATSAQGDHAEPLEAACKELGLGDALHDPLQAIYEIRNNNCKGVLADRDVEVSVGQMRVFLEHFEK